MPNCLINKPLSNFSEVAGLIERRSTSTPRWVLNQQQVDAISDIFEMRPEQIGIRPFGTSTFLEKGTHPSYTHYLDSPIPVMLLLRAKIDQVYREVSGASGPRRNHARTDRAMVERDNAERQDRQEDERKIQLLLDEMRRWQK